jgi:hypothetical protein
LKKRGKIEEERIRNQEPGFKTNPVMTAVIGEIVDF